MRHNILILNLENTYFDATMKLPSNRQKFIHKLRDAFYHFISFERFFCKHFVIHFNNKPTNEKITH